MAIVLNGTTGITAPDISVTAQSTDITTTGDITAVDATLSGGVYLGGTGAANYLDDYEEGTFTASDVSGAGLTFTYGQTSKYVVVGKICFITIFVQWPSTSNTSIARVSLPFTPDGVYSSLSKSYINGSSGQTNWLPLTSNGSASFDLRDHDGGDNQANNANLSTKSIIVSGCYTIA